MIKFYNYKLFDISKKIIALAVFIAYVLSEVFSWYLLETDSFTTRLFATGFADTVAWAHSARVNYIHDTWYRELMDDWRPIFIIPIHQLLTWAGYELFDLTLTGHRFFPFLSIHLAKILILYVLYREFGFRYLMLGGVFLAIYPPINELSRVGSVDSVQTGLYFLAAFLFYVAVKNKSNLYLFISGVFVSFAVIYKISGLFFIVLPFLYFFISTPKQELVKAIKDINSFFYFPLKGIFLVLVPYFIFWQVPNLDESVYFSIRMFGVHAGITSPFDIIGLVDHIVNFVTSRNMTVFIADYHSYWFVGYILYLMALSFLPNNQIKKIDYILLAVFFIFLLQIIFFDMAFRRYLGLLPFGILALFRLMYIVFSFSNIRVSYKGRILYGFSFYLLISYFIFSIYEISFDVVGFLIIFTLSSLLSFFMTVKLIRIKFAFLLVLLFTFFFSQNLFYTIQYFEEVHYGIKDASIELGKAVGEARIIEAHEYNLYNKTESGYMGSHAGQYKPDGWVYDDNNKKSLERFADTEYKNNFWALKLKVFNWLYEGFFDRWYLPEDYETLYKSNLFASYDENYANGNDYDHYLYTHYAKRHLVIGMNEPNVYVLDGVRFYDDSSSDVTLTYDDSKKVVIKTPDSLENRRWYGLNDTNYTYRTFNFRIQ